MNFRSKSVCVTGAGGSIGSELCRQLAERGVSRLTVVSLTEGALYNLLKAPELTRTEVVPVLGSVTDDRLMAESFEGCDVVYHAAAHKHVPICERAPLAAIDNNVRGTYIAAQAAINVNVPAFVYVSSDKAVFPASVMGATKRVSELMLRDVISKEPTKFVICRFGNVLDSAGSVLPLWREQIASGGPLTLTDPNCERYFMSIPQAVELLLTAAGFEGSDPYIFDMGKPIRMGALADQVMKEMKKRVDVRITGLRPGEKVTEVLTYGGPLADTRHPRIKRVAQDLTQPLTAKQLTDLLSAVRERDEKEALRRLWGIVKA